ncbi:hypothetical protein HDU67_006879 [Dinochytrium kinnereticum]|nr:hypothetical protein HDU67_006879 [Dinochytrium kinnereticum]
MPSNPLTNPPPTLETLPPELLTKILQHLHPSPPSTDSRAPTPPPSSTLLPLLLTSKRLFAATVSHVWSYPKIGPLADARGWRGFLDAVAGSWGCGGAVWDYAGEVLGVEDVWLFVGGEDEVEEEEEEEEEKEVEEEEEEVEEIFVGGGDMGCCEVGVGVGKVIGAGGVEETRGDEVGVSDGEMIGAGVREGTRGDEVGLSDCDEKIIDEGGLQETPDIRNAKDNQHVEETHNDADKAIEDVAKESRNDDEDEDEDEEDDGVDTEIRHEKEGDVDGIWSSTTKSKFLNHDHTTPEELHTLKPTHPLEGEQNQSTTSQSASTTLQPPTPIKPTTTPQLYRQDSKISTGDTLSPRFEDEVDGGGGVDTLRVRYGELRNPREVLAEKVREESQSCEGERESAVYLGRKGSEEDDRNCEGVVTEMGGGGGGGECLEGEVKDVVNQDAAKDIGHDSTTKVSDTEVKKPHDNNVKVDGQNETRADEIHNETTSTNLIDKESQVETVQLSPNLIPPLTFRPKKLTRAKMLLPWSLPHLAHHEKNSLHYGLTLLLTHCKNLRHLRLHLPIPSLTHLPLHKSLVPSLRSLDIFQRVTDAGLKALFGGEGKVGLSKLVLRKPECSSEVLVEVLRGAELKVLCLGGPVAVTGGGVPLSMAGLRPSRFVRAPPPAPTHSSILKLLTFNAEVNQSVERLGVLQTTLRRLDLSCLRPDPDPPSSFYKTSPGSTPVNQTGADLLKAISRCKNLTHLVLALCPNSGLHLRNIAWIALPPLWKTLKVLVIRPLNTGTPSGGSVGDSTVDEEDVVKLLSPMIERAAQERSNEFYKPLPPDSPAGSQLLRSLAEDGKMGEDEIDVWDWRGGGGFQKFDSDALFYVGGCGGSRGKHTADDPGDYAMERLKIAMGKEKWGKLERRIKMTRELETRNQRGFWGPTLTRKGAEEDVEKVGVDDGTKGEDSVIIDEEQGKRVEGMGTFGMEAVLLEGLDFVGGGRGGLRFYFGVMGDPWRVDAMVERWRNLYTGVELSVKTPR